MRTMGITQALADDDAVTGVPLQRERQEPACGEHPANFRQHGNDIRNVDHGIGGQNQIGARLRSRSQTLQHVVDLELGIKPGGFRLLDHTWGKIDAGEMIDLLGKS